MPSRTGTVKAGSRKNGLRMRSLKSEETSIFLPDMQLWDTWNGRFGDWKRKEESLGMDAVSSGRQEVTGICLRVFISSPKNEALNTVFLVVVYGYTLLVTWIFLH